jgi:hypothetical protein
MTKGMLSWEAATKGQKSWILLATEIRRITVQSQPEQIVCKALSQKYPTQKRADEVAEVV